jgi:hypothetical protein
MLVALPPAGVCLNAIAVFAAVELDCVHVGALPEFVLIAPALNAVKSAGFVYGAEIALAVPREEMACTMMSLLPIKVRVTPAQLVQDASEPEAEVSREMDP